MLTDFVYIEQEKQSSIKPTLSQTIRTQYFLHRFFKGFFKGFFIYGVFFIGFL